VAQDFAFVSCDIVGHSAEPDLQRQIDRIRGLNLIVNKVLTGAPPGTVVWASGGDGGHVAISSPNWLDAALDLICHFRDWSISAGVRLRIIAHYGEVDSIVGAGGITQLVGSGINLAGRLLDYGDQDRVVVSRQFVEAAEGYSSKGVKFHDGRFAQLKHFRSQEILLISIDSRLSSSWASWLASDRSLLTEAVNQRRYWDIIYYARRLMEVDVNDQDAVGALVGLSDHALTYEDPVLGRERLNPLFGTMDHYSRAEFIRSSQIVERDRNEILMHAGDSGDTMFIILRGEIAVLSAEDNAPIAGNGRQTAIQMGIGEIVGELAFALRRKRTATLQCLTPTTLLSFSPHAVEAIAEKSPARITIRQAMERFVKTRILEHVCNNVDYLIGRNRNGPLRGLHEPWVLLTDNSTLLTYQASAKRKISREDDDLRHPGLYVLVSGELREINRADNSLDGVHLPIIYAALGGDDLTGPISFEVITDAIVLRVAPEAFAKPYIPQNTFQILIKAVREALSGQQKDELKEAVPTKSFGMDPIKILFLAANPATTSPLQLDREVREIEEKLRGTKERDKLRLITKWAVRADDLQQYLLEYQPHIVHFSGHGSDKSELVLEDRNGMPRALSQATLLGLFKTLKDNIRVVVLNSCFSRAQAEAITSSIDCAIGMNKEIGDQVAITFASSFYRALGFGRSVATAFDLGKLALMGEQISEETTPTLITGPGVDISKLLLMN
jgi:CRP-like cAMP-binding protein